jgi:hypothetical protein
LRRQRIDEEREDGVKKISENEDKESWWGRGQEMVS